jgi:gliding motility-associated-like protein
MLIAAILIAITSIASSSILLFKKAIHPGIHPAAKPVSRPVFACPTIITDDVFIQASSCTANTGAILRLHGTGVGVHTYTWYDSNKKVVGTDSILMNMPGGQYTVTLRDEGKCPAATAGPFTIPINTGITINETKALVGLTNCNNSDGSVTGITVTGAVSFKWVSVSDTVTAIAKTADLTNVPIGIYQLRAFNATGCETDSKTYSVNSKTIIPIKVADTATNPTCNATNGVIKVRLLIAQNQPPIHWYLLDSLGGARENGYIQYTGNPYLAIADNLDNGTYRFAVGDLSTCVITLGTYSIYRHLMTIDSTNLQIINDKCGRHIGAIGGIDVIGGTPTPPGGRSAQHYYWYDENGNLVSKVKSLFLVGAGKYRVHVVDGAGACTADSRFYTIKDSAVYIIPPVVKATSQCLPGIVTVAVENLIPNTPYNFYYLNDAGDTTFIEQNTLGKIYKVIKKTTQFFVTRSDGTCESSKTKAEAVIAAPGVLIPNTFTPNNDGINDVWKISGLENFPAVQVNVYSRDGKQVYTSVGYGKPFDGTENGQTLPEGVYYYTIDLKTKDCGATSGSLTIIR